MLNNLFKKVEEINPNLFSINDDERRVEYSRVTGKWHYYVHDGERFMPHGQEPSKDAAIKAVMKVKVS